MTSYLIRFYDDEALFLARAEDEAAALDAFLADREKAGAGLLDRELCAVVALPELAPGEVAQVGSAILQERT